MDMKITVDLFIKTACVQNTSKRASECKCGCFCKALGKWLLFSDKQTIQVKSLFIKRFIQYRLCQTSFIVFSRKKVCQKCRRTIVQLKSVIIDSEMSSCSSDGERCLRFPTVWLYAEMRTTSFEIYHFKLNWSCSLSFWSLCIMHEIQVMELYNTAS